MLAHHIDVHVKSLAEPKRLFDALMPALRIGRSRGGEDYCTYYPQHAAAPFLCLMVADEHVAGSMRVAFAADDRTHVDALARIAITHGAQRSEGPELCDEYGPDYYAFFFEDASGNKFEICHTG